MPAAPRCTSCCAPPPRARPQLPLAPPARGLFSPVMISLRFAFHLKEPLRAKGLISNTYLLRRTVRLLINRVLVTAGAKDGLRHRPGDLLTRLTRPSPSKPSFCRDAGLQATDHAIICVTVFYIPFAGMLCSFHGTGRLPLKMSSGSSLVEAIYIHYSFNQFPVVLD